MPACSRRLETPDPMQKTGPLVLVGCGRMGSAMVEGWLASAQLDPADLTILTRTDTPALAAFAAQGVQVNPQAQSLAVDTVVLAIKPAQWRAAAQSLMPRLARRPDVVISVMAGVQTADLQAVFETAIARIMPTTAVAQGQGLAALWSGDSHAREVAKRLFQPVADVVELAAETDMDAATAVGGSAPAFIYAFVQALADAGIAQGLEQAAAIRLARGALRSAAAGLEGEATLDELVARIASPGGTTRAGLEALKAAQLDSVVGQAVRATMRRSGELSQS